MSASTVSVSSDVVLDSSDSLPTIPAQTGDINLQNIPRPTVSSVPSAAAINAAPDISFAPERPQVRQDHSLDGPGGAPSGLIVRGQQVEWIRQLACSAKKWLPNSDQIKDYCLSWSNWAFAGAGLVLLIYATRMQLWTTRKDFTEMCMEYKAINITSIPCEKVLNRTLPPPPFLTFLSVKRLRSRAISHAASPKANLERRSQTPHSGGETSHVTLEIAEALLATLAAIAVVRLSFLVFHHRQRKPGRSTEGTPELDIQTHAPVVTGIDLQDVPGQANLRRRGNNSSRQFNDYQNLLEASFADDHEAILSKIRAGANVNEEHGDVPHFALAAAMISGHTETIQLLLREGANPNQRTRDAEPLFHILARLSPTIIGYEDAFESGADINIKNGSQLSCLQVAVRYDREEITRWLLEKGANLEAKDIQGRTSMHIAARYSKVKIIKLLARHNADLEPFDDAFWFPIHHAVCYDRIPAVRYFIDRTYGGKELYRGPGPRYGGLEDTADATLTEKTVGSTLHLAAYHGHAEIIRALLSHGANIEARDEDGMTPLLVASQMGQYTALAHLVRHGANVNSQSNAKMTALHIAVSKNLVEITKQLLDAKVDVDACDLMRQTPLHKAVYNLNTAFDGQATIIKLLLACGADPLKRDIRGAIPLHYLAREDFRAKTSLTKEQRTNLNHSYTLGIRALTNNNASVNTQDEWGMTPLHWTAERSNLMTTMLLDIGADVHCADQAGNTPLHCALLQKEKTWDQDRKAGGGLPHHVIGELINRGAKIDCRNGHEETPYDIYMRLTARNGHPFSVGIERQHERDIGEELDPAERDIDWLNRTVKERKLEVKSFI